MSETLSPKKLAAEGQAAYKKGDFISAANAFRDASERYKLGGDELAAAEMANNLSVSLLQAGQAENALQAALGTEEVFERSGDLRRQAMAVGNQAAALESLNRLDEAVQHYELSAELLKQAGDNETRASVMQSLSALQLRQGRQFEALATMQAGLNGIKRPTTKQRLLRKLLQLPFKYLNR